MKRKVNGKEVQMTSEEEQAFISDQKLITDKINSKEQAKQNEKDNMIAVWDKFLDSDLNLTKEDKDLIKKSIGMQ